MKPQDFAFTDFILKHVTPEDRMNLNWCESIGMTAQEIEFLATSGGISAGRLRHLFELRFYKQEYERFNTETKECNGAGDGDNKTITGDFDGRPNNNGRTYEDIKPDQNA